MSSRGVTRIGCADFQKRIRMERRSFLKAGVLGAAGLCLADLLKCQSKAASGSNKSVIILWMRGGPSHIDMWDPKPNAPAEYRGEFGVQPSKVPGIILSDLLPMSGKIMDQWSIIRSLYHND